MRRYKLSNELAGGNKFTNKVIVDIDVFFSFVRNRILTKKKHFYYHIII